VEYYFEETSGYVGGDDSGWQDSPTYVDAGLEPDTQYSYICTARDKSPNQNPTGSSIEQSATTDVGDPGSDTEEHIYLMSLHGPFVADNDSDFLEAMQAIGAQQVDAHTWEYTNSTQGKTYFIHNVQSFDEMLECLYGEHHCIFRGHSNYGIGGTFIAPYSYTALHNMLDSIRYIDDDNIFNYSAPTVAVKIYRMARPGKWTNWWPIDSMGNSGIMPYDFGDPRGDPPFNYYIMYQLAGDPTYYKMETVRNSARERFPDSGVEPWDFNWGPAPNPDNPEHLKYFITNPTLDYDWDAVLADDEGCGPSGNLECPQPHYGKKTIIFPIKLDIDIERLRYKRIMLDMCTTCSYYPDTFNRGIMFCTTGSAGTRGSFRYLKEYVYGRSDQQIWEALQRSEPVYEYYDFSKPSPQ
jgi:hypothetical protein